MSALLNFHEKVPKCDIVRNKKSREPPLPLYLGLTNYGHARDKRRINELHNMGLSSSSDRVLELTSQLCRMVVQRSKEKNVVCPSNLQHGVFTVAAMDNIDHKTTSNTSVDEFHGTGISIFQLPRNGNVGTQQTFQTSFSDVAHCGNRSVPELPDFYAHVWECILPQKHPSNEACLNSTDKRMLDIGLWLYIIWKISYFCLIN